MIKSWFADPLALAARTADVLRALAPADLAGQEVYVVPASLVAEAHPELWTQGPDAGAWTDIALDIRIRPVLEELGLWRGRGFACVVRDDRIESQFVALALHELAHYCERADCLLTTANEEDAGQLVAELIEPYPKSAADPGPMGPRLLVRLLTHPARFHRAAVHLRYRAAAAGIDTAWLFFAGSFYGLSEPEAYIEALADECAARAGERIATIIGSDEPAAFAQLWRADNEPDRLRAWAQSEASLEESKNTALEQLAALLANAGPAEAEAMLRDAFGLKPAASRALCECNVGRCCGRPGAADPSPKTPWFPLRGSGEGRG